MFEEELELEKKEGGGFGPIILIVVLAAIVVGGIGWVYYTSKITLKADQASAIIAESLKERGPATVKFHSGHVEPSMTEKPADPHYRLLEKAGVVKVAKVKNSEAIDVSLTPDGEKMISSFPEFAKNAENDGTVGYVVPLAKRELVSIGEIKKISPSRFVVEYTWKWVPNKLGESFDTKGELLKDFNMWDRSVLIKNYGADLYSDPPQKMTVAIVKTDKGWQLATE